MEFYFCEEKKTMITDSYIASEESITFDLSMLTLMLRLDLIPDQLVDRQRVRMYVDERQIHFFWLVASEYVIAGNFIDRNELFVRARKNVIDGWAFITERK